MQIRALDFTKALVLAENANKHQDYQCIECQQIVRLRRGIHRKAHYYHVQPNRICRQHAKGMPHLMLQHFLKNILPEGEVELECQFAAIGRIADVAWHGQRLVYEIQCSPISMEEVKGRNENYASLGYQVVWIFHDNLYNQSRLSAAESFLRDHPHYFSNMDEEGEGIIYDQFSLITNGKRVYRLPVLSIDPSSPKYLREQQNPKDQILPFVLQRRIKIWPFIFAGDTIDRCLEAYENKEDAAWQAALVHLKGVMHLETKVGDLTHEIKTLLHFAETRSASLLTDHQASPTLQESPPSVKVEASFEPSLSIENSTQTTQEASQQLKNCLDMAQKIKGSQRFGSQIYSFLDSPADSFSLDLRRLCDRLRSETQSMILLYSPKDNQLLFASNKIKILTGWSPEKFAQIFFEILKDESEWKQGIDTLAMHNEAQIQLQLKTKSNQILIANAMLGLIPTGIFRNHIIAVLY